MREAPFEIREALQNGLRGDVRVPRGTPTCEELRNLKPTDFGAVSPEILSYPISDPVFAQAWPYPQLVRNDQRTAGGEWTVFFYDGTELRRVNEVDWATAVITLRQIESPATPAVLAAGGGPIQIANFMNSYFITDGVNLIIKTPRDANSLVFLNTVFRCNSVERFDDRVLIGGMQGTWLTNAGWTLIYNLWRETSDAQTYTGLDEAVDVDYILFSDEMGGDVDNPFEVLKHALGAFVNDAAQNPLFESLIRDAITERTIGLIPVRNIGQIQAMRRLGPALIVYGQKGVSLVERTATGYTERIIVGRGIPARGAVSGDELNHTFIDTDGDLWTVSGNGPTRIGYKEFIGGLTVADIVVSFDHQFREYWISDGVDTYIWTGKGLGGPVSLLPSSVIRSYNSATLIGTSPTIDFNVVVTPPVDLDSTSRDIVLIRTTAVDFGQRGQKHLVGYQVASDGVRDGRATVHYRYNQLAASAYIRRVQDKITQDGFVRLDVNLVDGKIEVLGVAPTQTAEYDYIEARYQTDDRRHVRGTQTNRSARL